MAAGAGAALQRAGHLADDGRKLCCLQLWTATQQAWLGVEVWCAVARAASYRLDVLAGVKGVAVSQQLYLVYY